MTAAGWYADPSARYEARWWDGELWTEAVSTNQVTGVDPLPVTNAHTGRGPQPQLPFEYTEDGPGTVDSLFTAELMTIEEQGDALGFTFGDFTFASPQLGPLGSVERKGRSKRRYELRSRSGQPIAALSNEASRQSVLVDANGQYLGEYLHSTELGRDMLLEVTVGGVQVAEVRSYDARGTVLTVSDSAGLVATIERPKGFLADNFSTTDNYTMTRHRYVDGYVGYLALMAPVAVDEARYRRDVRRNQRHVM